MKLSDREAQRAARLATTGALTPAEVRVINRLHEIADRCADAGWPHRERTLRGVTSDYVPWAAQRMIHRAPLEAGERRPPDFTVVVAARQVGKTVAAAQELVRVMCEKPGSYSILLAPTYQISLTAVRTVLGAFEGYGIPHDHKVQRKEIQLASGATWKVFSADRKESVRGPTINGLFMVDEAAYLSSRAWEAALGALVAVAKPQVLITTTPAGKNWVWIEWCNKDNVQLRCRSADSPYANHALIQRMRAKMSKEKAAQEFDAVFVDALLLAFPERTELWVDKFPDHDPKEPRDNVLGVDLGKEQDYVVVTLANTFGEFTPLGRWRRTDWPTTVDRIAAYAKRFRALVVIDSGYGYGTPCAEYLQRDHGVETELVNTAVIRTKAEIVEAARTDVQYCRITMLKVQTPTDARMDDDREKAPLWEVYDDELGRFQMLTQARDGEDVTKYRAPDLPGEHDDCPISFCLANWGRLHAYEGRWRSPETPDFKAFLRASRAAAATGPAGPWGR